VSRLQKLLLILVVAAVLAIAILTYPSVGSVALFSALILSFPIYFIQRFLNR